MDFKVYLESMREHYINDLMETAEDLTSFTNNGDKKFFKKNHNKIIKHHKWLASDVETLKRIDDSINN